jgi:hypothetical protein
LEPPLFFFAWLPGAFWWHSRQIARPVKPA